MYPPKSPAMNGLMGAMPPSDGMGAPPPPPGLMPPEGPMGPPPVGGGNIESVKLLLDQIKGLFERVVSGQIPQDQNTNMQILTALEQACYMLDPGSSQGTSPPNGFPPADPSMGGPPPMF